MSNCRDVDAILTFCRLVQGLADLDVAGQAAEMLADVATTLELVSITTMSQMYRGLCCF